MGHRTTAPLVVTILAAITIKSIAEMSDLSYTSRVNDQIEF